MPVVAQGGNQRGELRVFDDQHAALAERGEVLVGMERKDCHVAPRAGLDAVDVRADGLAASSMTSTLCRFATSMIAGMSAT